MKTIEDIIGPPPSEPVVGGSAEAIMPTFDETPPIVPGSVEDIIGLPPKGYVDPEQTMKPGMGAFFREGTALAKALVTGGFSAVQDKKTIEMIPEIFGRGWKEGYGDPSVVFGLDPKASQTLKDFTGALKGPDSPEEVAESAYLTEGLVRAAAMANRGINAAYHGVGDVLVHWGVPRDIVGMPDAFAGSPHMFHMGTGDIPIPIPKVGEGEYNRAAAVEALSPKQSIEAPPPAPSPNLPTSADIARAANPTLFAEHDALTQQRANILSQLQVSPFRRNLEAGGRTLGEGPPTGVTLFRQQLEGQGRRLSEGYAEPVAPEAAPPLSPALEATLAETNDRINTLKPLMDKAIANVEKEVALTITKEGTQYGNTLIQPDSAGGYNVGGVRVRSYEDAVGQAKAAEGEPTLVTPIKPVLNSDLADGISKSVQAIGRPVEEANAIGEVQAAHVRAMAPMLGVTPEEYLASQAAKFVTRAPPGQGAAVKGAQGATLIDRQGNAFIRVFKSGNASTGFHELGHSWLNEIFSLEGDPRATDGLKQIQSDTRRELGMGDDQTEPTTAQHETFARGFEQYLREGTAPTQGLQAVFAKISEWFKSLYETVDALGEPISAGMKSIYDRLLANDPVREVAANFADVHEADLAAATPKSALPLAYRVAAERDLISAMLPEEINNARLRARLRANVRPTSPTEAAGGGNQLAAEQPVADAFANPQPNAEPPEVSGGGAPVKVDGAGNLGDADGRLVKADGTPRPENITGQADINEIIEQTARDLPQTPTTGASILNLANILGIAPNAVRGGRVLFNDAHVRAAIRLLNESGAQVKAAMARAAASGLDADMVALQLAMTRHEMIDSWINAVGTDWATIGHQYNFLRNAMGVSKADLSSYLVENGGRDLAQLGAIAGYGKLLPSIGNLTSFLRASKNGKMPIVTYYLNSLLSGPFTHMWYGVGNTLNLVGNLGAVKIGEGVAAARTRITGNTGITDIGDRMIQGEAQAAAFGITYGFRKATSAAVDAFHTGLASYLPGEKVYNSANLGLTLPQQTGLPNYLQYPYKSVAAIHTFFKEIAYGSEMARLAHRQAVGIEGLVGDPAAQRIAAIMGNPSDELINLATDSALRQLYMRPTPPTGIMAGLSKMRESSSIAQILFPFVHYGTEITRNAFIEGSPLGFASKEVRNNMLLRNGGAAFDYQAGKMLFGTGVFATGAMGALSGLITGNGPQDPAQRHTWLLTNRPNSFNLGPISIPISRLGPLSLQLLLGANIGETYTGWYNNPSVKADVDSLAKAASLMILNVELEETAVRQIKDITEAAFDHGYSNALFAMAPNWLPYSSFLGQVARKIDPHEKEVETLLDAFLAKIPGASYLVNDRVDLFGNPIHYGDIFQGGPRYADDLVANELDKLNIGLSKVGKKIMNVQLMPQQYTDYATLAGQLTHKALTGIMKMPTWAPMTAGEKVKTIHTIVNEIRDKDAAKIIASQSTGTDNDIIRKATDAQANALK